MAHQYRVLEHIERTRERVFLPSANYPSQTPPSPLASNLAHRSMTLSCPAYMYSSLESARSPQRKRMSNQHYLTFPTSILEDLNIAGPFNPTLTALPSAFPELATSITILHFQGPRERAWVLSVHRSDSLARFDDYEAQDVRFDDEDKSFSRFCGGQWSQRGMTAYRYSIRIPRRGRWERMLRRILRGCRRRRWCSMMRISDGPGPCNCAMQTSCQRATR